MKKLMKLFLSLILIVVIAVVLYTGYFYFFTKSKSNNSLNVIPTDAIFMLQTKNISDAWKTLRESKLWSYLIASNYFGDIDKKVKKIDGLLKDNQAMNMILSERELFVSCHLITRSTFDFLIVVDMQKAAELPFLKESLSLTDYIVSSKNYRGEEITELYDRKKKNNLYMAIIDNLMVLSYQKDLVIDAVLQNKDEKKWQNNDKFKDVTFRIDTDSLFNFYFNYEEIDRFLQSFMSQGSDLDNAIGSFMAYSALNMTFEDEILSFKGFTNLHKTASYLGALAKVSPGKSLSPKVLSNQTALMVSICFDNFNDFLKSMKKDFSSLNSRKYKSYNKKIKSMETILKTDLKKDFFNWIGNEITFAKLRPSSKKSRWKDVVVTIHAKDISMAKKGLGHLTQQIKKTTPLRFDVKKYKNHKINYLNLHGFFMLFFGDLFKKLEKPYFTFIGDFAVFSNSEHTLKSVIDSYLSGNTLSRKKEFMRFKDQFNSKSNVNIFIQTPKIYTNLYNYSKPKQKKSLKKNKAVILSFARIGFQMVAEDEGVYQTTLMAQHDTKAAQEDALEKMEIAAADDLFNKVFETLEFKVKLTTGELMNSGEFKNHYSDNTVKSEGNISHSKPTGVWRSYYQNGNIKSSVNYKKGKVDGEATFYYDNVRQSKKAEVKFRNETIAGTYREYYDTGARKAVIKYKNGKMNGSAKFYYVTGAVKIVGGFDNAKKDGEWKYYTERGKLHDTVEWDDGKRE